MCSGCHNLKLYEKSSYLTTFACQFGRYRYKQLPFELAFVGDMFQRRKDEIFKDLPNVFGIVDDILLMVKAMTIHYKGYCRYADR